MKKERLYTTKEVSNILGVHPNTVRNMIKDGRMVAIKTRGSTGDFRVRQTDLEEYIDYEGYGAWDTQEETVSPSSITDLSKEISDVDFLTQCGNPFLLFGTYLEVLPRGEYSQALRGKAALWVQETFRQVRLRFHNSSLSLRYSSANDFLKTVKIGVAGKEKADGGLVLTSIILVSNEEKGYILDGTLQQFHPELAKGVVRIRRKAAETFYSDLVVLNEEQFTNAVNDRNSLFFQNLLKKLDQKRRLN